MTTALGTALVVIPDIHPKPWEGHGMEEEWVVEKGEEEEEAQGRYIKTFTGVKEGEMYTIVLKTVVNGKAISEVRKTVLAVPRPNNEL